MSAIVSPAIEEVSMPAAAARSIIAPSDETADAAEIVEKVLAEEKNLFPNLDWPAGRLYHALGLETPLYTPIFVMARVAGWAAHVIEQQANNRLIRPRMRYHGSSLRHWD